MTAKSHLNPLFFSYAQSMRSTSKSKFLDAHTSALRPDSTKQEVCATNVYELRRPYLVSRQPSFIALVGDYQCQART
jgi:hypothetical protein